MNLKIKQIISHQSKKNKETEHMEHRAKDHSIYMLDQLAHSTFCLLCITGYNQFLGSLGSTFHFCPSLARKDWNVPLLKSKQLRAYCPDIYTVQKMPEREKNLVTKSQRKCLSVRVVMFELHNTRYVSDEKSDTGCGSSGDYSS